MEPSTPLELASSNLTCKRVYERSGEVGADGRCLDGGDCFAEVRFDWTISRQEDIYGIQEY